MTLTEHDSAIIKNGAWLNDKIINAAQLLMKHDKDLLPVGGFQNTLLGQTPTFDVLTDESIQILHSGGDHWLTISTVGVPHPVVQVYDSLPGRLPLSTLQQIAALLYTKEKEIIIEYASVQVC